MTNILFPARLGGQLFTCFQDHTPFDVVAWHGKYVQKCTFVSVSFILILPLHSYVPYKYDLRKFTIVSNSNKDHNDPSVYCVLMAKSKMPGKSLVEFCAIGPHWEVAEGTFRLPVNDLSLVTSEENSNAILSTTTVTPLVNLSLSLRTDIPHQVLNLEQ